MPYIMIDFGPSKKDRKQAQRRAAMDRRMNA